MDSTLLIEKALEAREKAYVPYSNFMVGAAVLAENGEIYTGCNIENSSYGATNCGERTAVFSAVKEGVRNIVAIAIVGGKKGAPTHLIAPCGICRQVLSEFGQIETMKVILAKSPQDYKEYTLQELLPLIQSPQGDPATAFSSN